MGVLVQEVNIGQTESDTRFGPHRTSEMISFRKVKRVIVI